MVFYLYKGPASFFGMWISSFPSTSCWKDCPFPIKWAQNPCQKSFDHICEDSFLGSVFHWSISVSMPGPHSCDDSSFVVNFEMRKCETSTFVLFQDCFGYLSPLRFHMNFRMGFSISAKKCFGDLRFHSICRLLWVVWHFNNIKSFSLGTWDVCIYLRL